eukprot:s6516_g4.t1
MRVLLWVLSGHFVDDFNGVDVDGLAEGAFGGMAEFLELLGLQTKPSKAQKPAKEHIIQGVLVAITSDGVVLRPTPARVKKITQSTFGAVRKAALQPVYARAAAVSDTRLSVGLRAALSSLRALLALANIQPKVIPYIDDGAPAAIIYADAFYVPARRGQTQSHIPAEVNVRPGTRGRNGWRMGAELFYDWGTAPAEFLEAFAARKAFISGDLGSSPPLPGYGKDPAVNGVLAAFGSTAALADWLPDFRRVPSKTDLSVARRLGWTRVHTPVPAILATLRRAAQNLDFAINDAADELVNLAI